MDPNIKQVDGFEVVSELGKGGMGAVYKARDTQLDRVVALKIPNERLTENVEFVERFKREARAMARLKHPNIVQVYHISEFSGRPYFAMEFVEGRSLSDILRQEGAMPVSVVLKLFSQICKAFSYAHDEGVIHRDIKPGNIMVDQYGDVKITDFGLAKIVADNTLTSTGEILGTPLYMSPEQCSDKVPDHRSDIYSLGIVLYEMLTGNVPFNAKSPAAIIRMHLLEQPTPIRTFKGDIPEDVERILLKMIEKDPDKRYQDMDEVLADIQRCQQGESLGVAATIEHEIESPTTKLTADVPTTKVTPVKPPVKFKKIIPFAAALAVIVVAVGLVLGRSGGKVEAEKLIHEGDGHFLSNLKLAEDAFSQALKIDKNNKLARAGLGFAYLKQGKLDDAGKTFNELPDDPSVRAEAMAALSYEKGQLDAFRTNAQKADTLYCHVVSGNAALAEDSDDAVQRAVTEFKEGEAKPATFNWQKAELYNRLGAALLEQNETEKAKDYFDKAVSMDPAYSEAKANKGILLARDGNGQAALAALGADPQDEIGKLLKDKIERELEASKQEHVDELIKQVGALVAKGQTRSGPQEDDWSKRPLGVAFLPPTNKTQGLRVKAGFLDVLDFKLSQALHDESDKIKLVERKELDAILREQSLFPLQDSESKIRAGRLLGARLLVEATYMNVDSKELDVSLKFIDTETSEQKIRLAESYDVTKHNVSDVASDLASKSMEKLKEAYQGL